MKSRLFQLAKIAAKKELKQARQVLFAFERIAASKTKNKELRAHELCAQKKSFKK